MFLKYLQRLLPSWIYTQLIGDWGEQGFQKYFKNTGWMFIGRFFTLGVSFFVGIYMARYLGPERYGLLSYAISFGGLFGFLASLGVTGVIKRELVKNPLSKYTLIGTGMVLKFVGAVVAVSITILISLFTTSDPLTLGLIWLFSLTHLFHAFDIVNIYFDSQVQAKYPVVIMIIGSATTAILKLIIIWLGGGIIWLIAVYVVDSIIIAGGALIVFIYKGHSFKELAFHFPSAKKILRDSWPLMLSGLAISIYLQIDQIMIKNMLGNEPAGLYAVAVRLSEVWYFIPTLICASVFPAIVNALSENKKLFEERMRKLYSFMFWLALLIALATTLLANPIVTKLFGMAYIGSITTLQIYIWAGVSVFLGVAVSQYLLAKNFTRITFYITAIGAVTNVLLNLILIPQLGIEGAAIASVISYTLTTFGIFFFKKTRKHGWFIIKSIL